MIDKPVYKFIIQSFERDIAHLENENDLVLEAILKGDYAKAAGIGSGALANAIGVAKGALKFLKEYEEGDL
jgi:hypothetical protein